jgi:hypothetical protein
MKIYWFSFSYQGRNNGVCIVQADCKHSALDKTINLGLHPAHDDILCLELDELGEKDSHMEFNRLYSKADMEEFGYNAVNDIK